MSQLFCAGRYAAANVEQKDTEGPVTKTRWIVDGLFEWKHRWLLIVTDSLPYSSCSPSRSKAFSFNVYKNFIFSTWRQISQPPNQGGHAVVLIGWESDCIYHGERLGLRGACDVRGCLGDIRVWISETDHMNYLITLRVMFDIPSC